MLNSQKYQYSLRRALPPNTRYFFQHCRYQDMTNPLWLHSYSGRNCRGKPQASPRPLLQSNRYYHPKNPKPALNTPYADLACLSSSSLANPYRLALRMYQMVLAKSGMVAVVLSQLDNRPTPNQTACPVNENPRGLPAPASAWQVTTR